MSVMSLSIAMKPRWRIRIDALPLRVMAVLMVYLLLTVDATLQTSVIFNRSAAWSPWLFKLGPLSIADLILLLITVYVVARYSAKPKILASPYLYLCGIPLVYLFIGFLYNIGVYPMWKTYLYDFKVVLYLVIPFLFLSLDRQRRIGGWFTPTRIFIYSALASAFDFVYINLFGASEYPSFLGYPAFPSFVPFSVIIIGWFFAKGRREKALFLFLFGFEMVNAVNRLSLGFILSSVSIGLYMLILLPRMGRWARFGCLVAGLIAFNLLSVFQISNPLNIALLAAKGEGAFTRQIQLQNVLLSFNQNIPGIIGKGLGSTWFAYVPLPESDIYSVGTSVGGADDQAVTSPVQFVFNWVPPSLLYKWGVLGFFLLCFFISAYYQFFRRRIDYLKGAGLNRGEIRYLMALLLLSTVFIIENFTYIGMTKGSLITALLAFSVHQHVRERLEAVGAKE